MKRSFTTDAKKRPGVPRQENLSQIASRSEDLHDRSDFSQSIALPCADACRRLGSQAMVKGHRAGFDQGYLAGYADGLRTAHAYGIGHADGWRDGYLDAVGDQRALKRGRVDE